MEQVVLSHLQHFQDFDNFLRVSDADISNQFIDEGCELKIKEIRVFVSSPEEVTCCFVYLLPHGFAMEIDEDYCDLHSGYYVEMKRQGRWDITSREGSTSGYTIYEDDNMVYEILNDDTDGKVISEKRVENNLYHSMNYVEEEEISYPQGKNIQKFYLDNVLLSIFEKYGDIERRTSFDENSRKIEEKIMNERFDTSQTKTFGDVLVQTNSNRNITIKIFPSEIKVSPVNWD